MPEDERDIIFDRFSRGSGGGNRAGDKGVGLGLALVDEHVRLHGGRVWVEDRRDGETGARFVVELPVVEPPEGRRHHGDPGVTAPVAPAASPLVLATGLVALAPAGSPRTASPGRSPGRPCPPELIDPASTDTSRRRGTRRAIVTLYLVQATTAGRRGPGRPCA